MIRIHLAAITSAVSIALCVAVLVAMASVGGAMSKRDHARSNGAYGAVCGVSRAAIPNATAITED